MSSITNNAVVRKSLAKAQRFGSQVSHRLGLRDDKGLTTVLCNSMPKSGTHLLLQILQGMNLSRYQGGFIASIPSIRFRERSTSQIVRKLRNILPGELIPAHLHHSVEAERTLDDAGVRQVLIVRDPRDLVLSEVHYLTHMAKWHGMSATFRGLADDTARLSLAVHGAQGPSAQHYPSLADRLQRFMPWCDCQSVHVVRYEDLVGEDRERTVREIAQHLAAGSSWDIDRLTTAGLDQIDPKRSHTFRRGSIGNWKAEMPSGIAQVATTSCQSILDRLGYAA